MVGGGWWVVGGGWCVVTGKWVVSVGQWAVRGLPTYMSMYICTSGVCAMVKKDVAWLSGIVGAMAATCRGW